MYKEIRGVGIILSPRQNKAGSFCRKFAFLKKRNVLFKIKAEL